MKESAFIRACMGKSTDYKPIWLMRQAGRYIPEYRELRKKYEIMEICRNPEVSSAVSAMPVEMFGVDAAIIFQDLMVPLEPAGIKFKLVDKLGPVISNPIGKMSDVDGIKEYDVSEVGFVADSIRSLKDRVDVPVIGFSGAPFTMACYMIDGMRAGSFDKTISFVKNNSEVWHALMRRLTKIVINYLKLQSDAGVDAIQLFDTWCGMLDGKTYSEAVAPYTREIFKSIQKEIPKIHFALDSSAIIGDIASNGSDVISMGWKNDMAGLWSEVKSRKAVQGNLNPEALASGGKRMLSETDSILRSVGSKKGHVFNLGHGVLPETDPKNVKRLIEYVHEYKLGGA